MKRLFFIFICMSLTACASKYHDIQVRQDGTLENVKAQEVYLLSPEEKTEFVVQTDSKNHVKEFSLKTDRKEGQPSQTFSTWIENAFDRVTELLGIKSTNNAAVEIQRLESQVEIEKIKNGSSSSDDEDDEESETTTSQKYHHYNSEAFSDTYSAIIFCTDTEKYESCEMNGEDMTYHGQDKSRDLWKIKPSGLSGTITCERDNKKYQFGPFDDSGMQYGDCDASEDDSEISINITSNIDKTEIKWTTTDDKLTVTLPSSYSGKYSVKLIDSSGATIEKGAYGESNQYTFTKKGSEYSNPSYLQVGSGIYQVDNPGESHNG